MHRNVSHNRCYPTFRDFKTRAMTFLERDVSDKWHAFRDSVTDNFRVIDPACPFPGCHGSHAGWIFDEEVPSGAARVDDGVIVFLYCHAELVGA